MRCPTLLLCLLAFVPPTALAQGCGPTRLKVDESVTLDIPPAKAWAMIGDFQDTSWNREATSSTGSGGNKPEKAVRIVTLRGGATLGESLFRYDAAAMRYAYHLDRVDVARLPVQNASGTLEVVPARDGAGSIVHWKFAFYRNLAPGEGAPDAADAHAVAAMRTYLHAGLGGLKSKADPGT